MLKAESQITITELAAAYWEFVQAYYVKNGKPSGWLDHIRLMLRKVREIYGLTPAVDFGPLKLKAIRQTLIDAGHSRVYINKLVPIITRMFKWAAAAEIIPGGVYHALRTVEGLRRGRTEAPETKPVLPVADEVVETTLPYLPRVVADMVRFQRLTARAREKFANYGHATWIETRKFGNTGPSHTRQNILAESELSLSARRPSRC